MNYFCPNLTQKKPSDPITMSRENIGLMKGLYGCISSDQIFIIVFWGKRKNISQALKVQVIRSLRDVESK